MLEDITADPLYEPFRELREDDVLVRAQTYDGTTLKLWYDNTAAASGQASADIVNALSGVEQRFAEEVPPVNRPCFTSYEINNEEGFVKATMNDIWFDAECIVKGRTECNDDTVIDSVSDYETLYSDVVEPAGFGAFSPDAEQPHSLVNWRSKDLSVQHKQGYAETTTVRGTDSVTLEHGDTIIMEVTLDVWGLTADKPPRETLEELIGDVVDVEYSIDKDSMNTAGLFATSAGQLSGDERIALSGLGGATL